MTLLGWIVVPFLVLALVTALGFIAGSKITYQSLEHDTDGFTHPPRRP